MAFTDRFIEVMCLLFNSEEAEIMNKSMWQSDHIPIVKKINPTRIESYGEAIPLSDFREDNKCWTNITMQSGDEIMAIITVYEFEKLLNNHQ